VGAAIGGTLGFWIACLMENVYATSKMKLGAGIIKKQKFSFSAVFFY
tara:strand:- start:673 stop:813 length:141 start_codon:yes stop_codon:yes gene_type:complete